MLLVGIVALAMVAWLSVSTGNFLVVIDYRYDAATKQFELRRRVDWYGDVNALWSTEAIGNGQQCSELGVSTYERYATDRNGVLIITDGQPTEITTVRFPLSDRLAPCMEDPNATLVTKWAMRVWGPIFLRPTMRYIPPRE